MGKTIGVISLKGGVGKTSAVVALGGAFAELGKKVLLIDNNLSSPTLGLHLNIITPETTLHQVLHRKANINDAIHSLDGIDVIPSSIVYDSEVNPFQLKDKIKFLKKKYDIILIDSSPKLDDETLSTMLASDEILVVTTPDIPTLSTTIKAVKAAKQKETPISGIILNKVYNKRFELPLKDIEETSGIPVMAVIPHDTNILKALSKFKVPTIQFPNSESSQEFKKLAATLFGEKYKPVKLKSFFRWINPKKQDINRTIFYQSVFE